jgi:hypothetical protein
MERNHAGVGQMNGSLRIHLMVEAGRGANKRARRILAIGIWLLHFGCQFHQTPDRFGTGWKVGLAAPPLVHRP